MVESIARCGPPEIEAEQRQLVKATADIAAGRNRLRNQLDRLQRMEAAGNDTRQAERLAQAMQECLLEWERHRGLIEQRIAYLRRWPAAFGPAPLNSGPSANT